MRRVEGQRITLNRWQALVVRLDEDPSYGQRWEMQRIASSTVIAPVQHDFLAKPGTDPASQNSPATRYSACAVSERVRNRSCSSSSVHSKRTVSKTIRFDVVVR